MTSDGGYIYIILYSIAACYIVCYMLLTTEQPRPYLPTLNLHFGGDRQISRVRRLSVVSGSGRGIFDIFCCGVWAPPWTRERPGWAAAHRPVTTEGRTTRRRLSRVQGRELFRQPGWNNTPFWWVGVGFLTITDAQQWLYYGTHDDDMRMSDMGLGVHRIFTYILVHTYTYTMMISFFFIFLFF